MAYPAEYLIRIFKGSCPKLNFNKELYPHQKILEVSCGDGRNLTMLRKCGFTVCGTEISEEIIQKTLLNLSDCGISDSVIKVGHNGNLPYSNEEFDFLIAWNVCYYKSEGYSFLDHVKEYSRVLKPKAYLVLSIPQKTAFIYEGSEKIKESSENLAIIHKDPYGIRNGTSIYIFDGEDEIEKAFSPYFSNFIFASIFDDCFGHKYHFHICVCTKI
ncbi:MAG: class I SAM-dependent methyltransferase [Deferribacteraceae bacterium]|nr:class I SAM-dependent methyltransferase [Deferribacteraceae bacterium]